MAQQPGVGDGAHRGEAQLGAGQTRDLPEGAHVEQPVDGVDFVLGHAGRSEQLAAQGRGAVGAELDPHDLAEAPATQLVLDRLQQVGGVVGDLQVGVAGDAEGAVVHDLHAGEEHVEVVGDHLLERHERDSLGALTGLDGDEAGEDLGGDLHAGEHGLVVDGVAHEHGHESERLEM